MPQMSYNIQKDDHVGPTYTLELKKCLQKQTDLTIKVKYLAFDVAQHFLIIFKFVNSKQNTNFDTNDYPLIKTYTKD